MIRLIKAAAAVLAVFVLLAAAAADSRYHLKVTEYTLDFPNLPQEFDGLRIVQLSDMHGATFGRGNRRLIEAVLALEPDIIAITGDMVSDKSELPAFEALIAGIADAAPVYYVYGNHEWAGKCALEVGSMLEKYNVTVFRNGYEPLYRSGSDAHIIIGGAEDPNGYADMKPPDAVTVDMQNDYPGDFIIWLCHRNDYVQQYRSVPVDLILCGHAHGGIIRLPFIGGLLNLHHRLGAEYEKGVYSGDRFRMVVSCGLGNSIAVPRLFNRPELVAVTLKKQPG